MVIKCDVCETKYDTDIDDNCPTCGDDNEDQVKELKDE